MKYCNGEPGTAFTFTPLKSLSRCQSSNSWGFHSPGVRYTFGTESIQQTRNCTSYPCIVLLTGVSHYPMIPSSFPAKKQQQININTVYSINTAIKAFLVWPICDIFPLYIYSHVHLHAAGLWDWDRNSQHVCALLWCAVAAGISGSYTGPGHVYIQTLSQPTDRHRVPERPREYYRHSSLRAQPPRKDPKTTQWRWNESPVLLHRTQTTILHWKRGLWWEWMY